MSIRLSDSIWVMTKEYFSFGPVKLLHDTLTQKNIKVFVYDEANLEDLKRLLTHTDNHIVFHLPLKRELHSLRPLLKSRRNFSSLYSDWWTDSYDPFVEYAEALIFHHYNIIDAIKKNRTIPAGTYPLFSPPQRKTPYERSLSFARIPYLFAIPYVDMIRAIQRRTYPYSKKQLIYMPFAINPVAFQDLPEGPVEYDFVSAGSSSFFCITRNCYVPACFSFINLYADRLKLINTMLKTKGVRVFDDRKTRVFGRETLAVMKKSKFAIATGGLHQASILKYLEIIACGTPIIGKRIPYEFPLLKHLVYQIDMLELSEHTIQEKLRDAIHRYPKYKQKVEEMKPKVFKRYNQNSILDIVQKQYDGEGVHSDYLDLTEKS